MSIHSHQYRFELNKTMNKGSEHQSGRWVQSISTAVGHAPVVHKRSAHKSMSQCKPLTWNLPAYSLYRRSCLIQLVSGDQYCSFDAAAHSTYTTLLWLAAADMCVANQAALLAAVVAKRLPSTSKSFPKPQSIRVIFSALDRRAGSSSSQPISGSPDMPPVHCTCSCLRLLLLWLLLLWLLLL